MGNYQVVGKKLKSIKMALFLKLIKCNSNENPNNIFHGTWQANSNIEMEK